MKTVVAFALCGFLVLPAISSAQIFDKLKREAGKVLGGSTAAALTEDEAVRGIKEALEKGVTKGTELVSKPDGFLKNPEIKIPFPNDAQKVESTLRSIGMGKEVDKSVETMNRAAEQAANEAKPIFVEAIKGMTITDALNIVKGDDRAATSYLQRTTSPQLIEKFKPIIQAALDKTNATKYWKDVISAYNKVPLVAKVNPDLNDYVTQKAIEGLFTMVAKEEVEIRKNPASRTTDLLKKVFGK